jgi:HTH-type transcriptional regulator/antitoxin HigA
MNIKSINSKKDHKAALKRVDELWDAKLNTPESDELGALTILVESYEAKAFPMDKPEPIEAIKFRMDQMGTP